MSDDFEMDWQRDARTGVPEAVLCGHKSMAQIEAIVAMAHAGGKRLLLTRLDEAGFAALGGETGKLLDYDPLSRTAVLGGGVPLAATGVGIVAAGTSDLPVAREAARALAFCGHESPIIADVGVAGLWRLTSRLEEIRRFRVVIAVAGMEGALFSVLAGLAAAPVIAVPASVGYGVAAGGRVALDAALASCSPGIVTVNIDNGFGAAAAAIKMLGMRERAPASL
ncbi:nickel pincer cofactor biosynthesis protein LarB [Mesorhizobium sp. CN2-181]|uniref:nickel pincer cofactor biosynthesis protein LarB n=1 Tax=Mesorhizobium yinganensis TaxID=3157707 RepID=UPI0032B766D6